MTLKTSPLSLLLPHLTFQACYRLYSFLILQGVLSRLRFLANDKFDRFRVVIDSTKCANVLQTINSDPYVGKEQRKLIFDREFTLCKMPILVNKERVSAQKVEGISKIRPDAILSSGTIGFPNFISMAFLLVVCSTTCALSVNSWRLVPSMRD